MINQGGEGGGHKFRNKIPCFSPTMLILHFFLIILLISRNSQSGQVGQTGWVLRMVIVVMVMEVKCAKVEMKKW